ncbi:MAG: class I SAM-dependent methyltransferase [Asgard group archaeon]|nr:class I SAM-dependent methyltransferase [Asgard group archaeon]
MQKDSTKAFSDRVKNYIKYRPKYPSELIAELKKARVINEQSVIADIGSGTGFFTELLLSATNGKVYAVEPNLEMRLAAEELLGSKSNFVSVNGTAEQTTIKDDTVDVIAVAQAFHWFDLTKTKEEFLRILKPEGYLILVWNERLTTGIPFQVEYELLLQTFCTEYEKPSYHKIAPEQIREFYDQNSYREFTCSNFQTFNFSGLQGRLESSSYAPKKEDPSYESLINNLKEIFDKYQIDNKVTMQYETQMYYGKMSWY